MLSFVQYKLKGVRLWLGWGGQNPVVSTVGRIDYYNDTITSSPKGPLSSNRVMHGYRKYLIMGGMVVVTGHHINNKSY